MGSVRSMALLIIRAVPQSYVLHCSMIRMPLVPAGA